MPVLSRNPPGESSGHFPNSIRGKRLPTLCAFVFPKHWHHDQLNNEQPPFSPVQNPIMLTRLHQFRRWAGVDRAVFYSNATQMLRLVTGPITMLLVLRYLTPEVQGYFYAFAGVAATQVFLEMGFSQNILQFASHEFAKLRFTPQRTLEGDPVALSRLISLGRLAFGYYAVAAAIMLVAIGAGGHLYFTLAEHHHLKAIGTVAQAAAAPTTPIAWQGAWWIIAITAALSLAINPAWSLLEGCNQITSVAQIRLASSLAGFVGNAVSLITGLGIYASAVGTACSVLIGIGFLLFQWRPFLGQFRQPARHGKISWRREIWPFQWRIAVSWMSGYFIFDIINPIAFAFCGAIETGRIGMSLQLINMIRNIALTWVTTKAPRFGMLVAGKAWKELDSLWQRSTVQSVAFYLLGSSAFVIIVSCSGTIFPALPNRLAPFSVNLWLCGAMLVQVLINAMAIVLRAHKQEPYMWLSVFNAAISIGLIIPLTWWLGIYGEAMGLTLASWLTFVPALKIYRTKRMEYRADKSPTAFSSTPNCSAA
jgi:hypothetical protein